MSNKIHQDIAIVGAGIIGLMSALYLRRAGHVVTLYDPAGFPAKNASASAKAGGMLAPYSEIEHMSPAWIKAGLAGIKAWQALDLPNIGLQQRGSLLLAHGPDRYMLERFRSHLPPALQELQDTATLEPVLKDRFPHALHLTGEAHLNPVTTLLELCKINKEEGVQFNEAQAEPPILSQKFDTVIDCRGMGAAKNDPDLRGVKGEIATLRNEEFTLTRPVRLMHPRYPLYIVPRGDGIFTIGATQIESADSANVNLRSGLELLSAAYSLHPSFGDSEILDITSGIRPAYPDNLPRIKTRDNIISANGLFRHGYLLAPLMADCITAYVSGKTTAFSPLFTGDSNEAHHQRAA